MGAFGEFWQMPILAGCRRLAVPARAFSSDSGTAARSHSPSAGALVGRGTSIRDKESRFRLTPCQGSRLFIYREGTLQGACRQRGGLGSAAAGGR